MLRWANYGWNLFPAQKGGKIPEFTPKQTILYLIIYGLLGEKAQDRGNKVNNGQ